MPAHAAVLAATSSAQSFLLPALLILLLVGLFVMNSRTRKKMAAKQDTMRSTLRIGTKVQMISGLKGTVAFVDGQDVGIEIADGVVATFNSRAVAEVLSTPDAFATPPADTAHDDIVPDDASGLIDESPAAPPVVDDTRGERPTDR